MVCLERGTVLLFMLSATRFAAVAGHGAMTFPRSRNAYDGTLAPWSSWSYPCDRTHQGDNCTITGVVGVDAKHYAQIGGACPISAHDLHAAGKLDASNGQACYWFSNGCTVGCNSCDGTTSHVGHGTQRFLYKGMNASTLQRNRITIPNPFNPPPGDMVMDPDAMSKIQIKPGCTEAQGNGQKATMCSKSLRTINTQAKCGSKDDIYFYSPWRYPGAAPMIDSCGSAGGRFPGQPIGEAGAQYRNTTLTKQGDLGSTLPPMPSQATWKAGRSYDVGWTVAANHGGGYAYRMAPLDSPLNEAAFGKMPLDFEGNSALRWGGNRASQVEFNSTERGWETSDGTVPQGSMWRKNPIPPTLWGREGATFEPVCKESQACIDSYSIDGGFQQGVYGICKCSGLGEDLPTSLEVVDRVVIPAGTVPGRYVLQWRWDCEESDQIWASCSDITITA